MSRKGNPAIVALLLICLLGLVVSGYYGPLPYICSVNTYISATQAMVDKSGNIALAIKLYCAHMGQYPATLLELYERPRNVAIASNWKGPYVDNPDSLQDAWKRSLQYACPGRHNKDGYDLWSLGPDGQDNTADDIGNW